jgi:hypothetical protein
MTSRKKFVPDRVQVGPFEFTIDWSVQGWSEAMESHSSSMDPDYGRFYGFTDPRTCSIWINPHAAATFQRETLLHEIMHACQAVAALPNEEPVKGEEFVTRISPILLDTLTRNVGLIDFLLNVF